MEGAELEGLAEWAYRVARLPDDVPAPGIELARRLLSNDAPLVRGYASMPAWLSKTPNGATINLRHGLSPTQLRWLVAHELAEWILEREDYREPDAEVVAEALAARLIAPRRAVVAALRWGLDVPELAEAFVAPQSSVLLRRAEVSEAPTALVTPARVYVRGGEWGWPGEEEVRRLAAEPRPGLAKVQITDARRRVGLVAG